MVWGILHLILDMVTREWLHVMVFELNYIIEERAEQHLILSD